MQTLTLTRTALLATGLVATGIAAACEEEPECVVNADCSLGLVCSDGTCVTPDGQDDDDDDGGGGGGGGGGFEGEGESFQPVQLVSSLTTLQSGDIGALGTSAQQPAGTVLVGLYESGSRDEILFFNPATGILPTTIGPAAGVNFIGNPIVGTQPCRFDHASVQVGYGVGDNDELWLGCSAPSRVLQTRTASLTDQIVAARGPGADFVIGFGPDAIDTNVAARRMYAARGDSFLYVERRSEAEATIAVRSVDDTPSFGAIAGLTLVAETDNQQHGDLVAVFDRDWPETSGPALVIIERQSLQGLPTTWEVYTDRRNNRHVLQLPAATHAVRLLDIPDPINLELTSTEEETVNLEVYEPVAGLVEFGRYETAITTPGPVTTPVFSSTSAGAFNPLRITRGTLPTTTPAATDRILLLPAGSDAVFYVMSNVQTGWKLPLHRTKNDARDNEVRFATFAGANAAARAIGIVAVPSSTTTAWLGMQVADKVGQDQLLPVVFDQ